MHKFIGHFGYPNTKLLPGCKVCPFRPGAAYELSWPNLGERNSLFRK